MMKKQKIYFGLAGLIIILLIGINIFQYLQNKKLSENAAPMAVTQGESIDAINASVKMVNKNTPKSMGSAVKNPGMSYIRELEYQLNATEKELEMVSAQLDDELKKKEASEKLEAQIQKNVLRNSLKRSVDSDYGLLYGRLDLSPEMLEGFKRIVIDWRVANRERSLLMNKAFTDEEKEEIYRLRQEARDKYNEEFVDLMGEEKFIIYDDFKNRKSERYELNSFMKTLPPEDRIDDAQMDDLIDTMYEVRKAVEIEMEYDADAITFSSDMNEDKGARVFEMLVGVYKEWEEISGDILPPDQAEQYNAYMRQQRENFESQFKMMSF